MSESYGLSKESVPRTEHLGKQMFGDASTIVWLLSKMLQIHHLHDHLHLYTKSFGNQISTFPGSPWTFTSPNSLRALLWLVRGIEKQVPGLQHSLCLHEARGYLGMPRTPRTRTQTRPQNAGTVSPFYKWDVDAIRWLSFKSNRGLSNRFWSTDTLKKFVFASPLTSLKVPYSCICLCP